VGESLIDYPAMVRRALRGVVREALALAARDGLPGDHHFFVSFATVAEGVSLPRAIRDLHPERLTIILQHQYWDLEVDDAGFAVTLSFGGQRQRIAVPFAAVEAFADPAVELELRFADPPAEPQAGGDPASSSTPPVSATADPSSPATDPPGGDVIPFGRPRRR
jgi:hypothetical protein